MKHLIFFYFFYDGRRSLAWWLPSWPAPRRPTSLRHRCCAASVESRPTSCAVAGAASSMSHRVRHAQAEPRTTRPNQPGGAGCSDERAPLQRAAHTPGRAALPRVAAACCTQRAPRAKGGADTLRTACTVHAVHSLRALRANRTRNSPSGNRTRDLSVISPPNPVTYH